MIEIKFRYMRINYINGIIFNRTAVRHGRFMKVTAETDGWWGDVVCFLLILSCVLKRPVSLCSGSGHRKRGFHFSKMSCVLCLQGYRSGQHTGESHIWRVDFPSARTETWKPSDCNGCLIFWKVLKMNLGRDGSTINLFMLIMIDFKFLWFLLLHLKVFSFLRLYFYYVIQQTGKLLRYILVIIVFLFIMSVNL